MRPDLVAKLDKVLASLPQSTKWQQVYATGLQTNSRYPPFEKEDPAGWVANIHSNPLHAGTFADWIRGFNGAGPYGPDHYIDMPFEGSGGIETSLGGNAVAMVNKYVAEMKGDDLGERAWATAWVLHLVGDLHMPLHCITRKMPDGTGDDHGGNSIRVLGTNLHALWDDILDPLINHDPVAYAKAEVARMKGWPSAEKQAFKTQRADLNPADWAQEGRTTIKAVGYPSDPQNQGVDYKAKITPIAQDKVLLAGARMADLLEKSI
jgi:hypothetical protein